VAALVLAQVVDLAEQVLDLVFEDFDVPQDLGEVRMHALLEQVAQAGEVPG
jgi:hypothetical protein